MTYTVQLSDRKTGWVIRQLAGVDLTAALAAKTQWMREFHRVDHLVETPLDDLDDWAHKPVRMAVHVAITHAA
jgi:hypothetical protein